MKKSKKIVTDGYQVDEKKFIFAEKKIEKLLNDMFGTEYDGDSNVQFVLIDNQRYEYFHHFPIRRSFNTKTSQEMLNSLRNARVNCEIAEGTFKSLFSIYTAKVREEMELANKEKENE